MEKFSGSSLKTSGISLKTTEQVREKEGAGSVGEQPETYDGDKVEREELRIERKKDRMFVGEG